MMRLTCALCLALLGAGCDEGQGTTSGDMADVSTTAEVAETDAPDGSVSRDAVGPETISDSSPSNDVSDDAPSVDDTQEDLPKDSAETDGGPQPAVSTYVCTNPQPLECPANDCYETASGPDNDSATRATPLGIDGDIEAILCSAGEAEYDYYGVGAAPGCAMSVVATFEQGQQSPAGDLSLYIERAGTSVIQDTNSDLDGAVQLDVVSRSPEPYQVYLINTVATDAVYTVSTTADCAPLSCPENDRNEPNDTIVTASGGKAPLTLIGDVFGAIACTGDVDWYFHPASSAGSGCTPKAIVRYDPKLTTPVSVDIRMSADSDMEETTDATTPGVLVVTAASNVPGTARVGVQPTGDDEAVYTIELLCD